MSTDTCAEIAAAAARLVVDEGMEYGPAKHKAARAIQRRAGRRPDLPTNEQVEDAVREELALFHAETQVVELAALRGLAMHWMERLAAFRPHLAGAAWRGTATRQSAVHLELYCDDAKTAEIELINQGVHYDSSDAGGADNPVLSLIDRVADWREPVTVHLSLLDHDALRGALKPDPRGRSWRGDTAALRRLIATEAAR